MLYSVRRKQSEELRLQLPAIDLPLTTNPVLFVSQGGVDVSMVRIIPNMTINSIFILFDYGLAVHPNSKSRLFLGTKYYCNRYLP
jgi:hypothetical protein